VNKQLLSITGLLVAGVVCMPQTFAAQPQATGAQAQMVVTLLGTGTPLPSPSRDGNSTLVQAGGLNLVFDAGRGVAVRLAQVGVPLGKIDGVFLTHFHSDHLNGLADLWMTGYLPNPQFAGRNAPLDVYGPEGTAHLVNGLMETYSKDISIREADERVPDAGTRMSAHEFSKDGVILDRHGVTVTAFEVNHGPLIKPSYGYRVDYAGHSVAISGDTKYDPNVIKYGAGTDLLIHEVMVVPKAMDMTPAIQRILDHHTSPEDAGRIFSQAHPRMAVYSHIVVPRPDGLDELVARTRSTYSGPLVVGEDLTRFVIGSSIAVFPMYSDSR
jgi:ribonuclease Z